MGTPASVESKARRFLLDHGWAHHRKVLLVGVSGGPDSVCLLHVLHRLSPELELRLHVAHLNHQLRGADADADARYVRRLCARLGVPSTVERRDVESYRRQHRLSLEEAARHVRYSFFADVAAQVDATAVALGHTADDQVETVLLHLVRGTGLTGLRGMQPVSTFRVEDGRTLTLLRPLLEVLREDTAAYCLAFRLRPRSDITNLSRKFLRNRIRLELLPRLRKYNPTVNDALLRLARIATDDLAFLEARADEAMVSLVERAEDGLSLHIEKFQSLPPALQRYLLRRVIEQAQGTLADTELQHVESVRGLLAPMRRGQKLHLPGGLVAARYYGRLWIGRGEVPCPWPALEGEHALTVPGETCFCGWRVTATIEKASECSPKNGQNGLTACLNFEETGGQLFVRTWQPGDRFRPLGMAQPKKLQDFFVDAKVPQPWRRRVPLVCSRGKGIVWVVGYRIDERFKVRPETKKVLRLGFQAL